MIKIESKNGEIEAYGSLPSERVKCMGYKETKVIWLSAETMMLCNADILISEDIALALDSIPEIIRQARIDQLVDECSAWIKKRQRGGLYL